MASRASSNVTTDHEQIRQWAEERGGKPACVRGTGERGDIGILRLDFPGYTGSDKLEEISWDDWFEKFDERGLALLFQEQTARGQRSNFNKIISRETAEERGGSSRSASTRGSSRAAKSRGGTASKKSGAKKASAKKSTGARKSSAKKSSGARKSSAKKSSGAKKSSAKKSSGTASKRSGAKSAGKTAAKKSSATKSGARKSSAKTTSARKSSGAKSSSRRSTGSKSAGRTSGARTRAQGASSRKAAAKKSTTKKAASRSGAKASTRRSAGGNSRNGGSSRGGSRSASSRSGSRGTGRSKSRSNVTVDHDEIRQWAEERGAQPACVVGTGGKGDPGMIRLDFPGFSGAGSLQPISWDEWFQAFDENGLALLYQETTAAGEQSNFNKLVARKNAANGRSGARTRGKR